MAQILLREPLPPTAVHLCVDMQNIFAPGAPWATPWMERVAPVVTALAERFAARTVFTRFITPVPSLKRLVPPAAVVDKTRYSAFAASGLSGHLTRRRADTVIVTGSETDVCVLATVLGAVDRGLRVVIVTDAICSSSDEGHDALLTVYRGRFSEQIETATAEVILSQWQS
jgi:nicotinamidase-related amidase